MDSSLCEKPERHVPRRLSDHLTFEGQKQKVHSLVDKVYSRKNLKLAWERVCANQGAGGTDGVTIGEFEADLDANLERLHRELREKTYRPQAVRRLEIPKRGAPGNQDLLAYLRSMTGSASKRWSIAWSRSLRRSLIRAALGIARVARPPMPWPKSGAKWRLETSGSWMRT
jgi:hypothetical protein